MSKLIAPHGGGHLRPLLVPKDQRAEALDRAASLKKLLLSSREVSDLFMLGMGAYTPLDGFMGYENWKGAVVEMRLANGIFWPIPITLSVSKELASSLAIGEEVALLDGESGETLGLMMVREKYTIDRALECLHVFRTNDPKHPGVEKVLGQGEVNIAGPVIALSEGPYPAKYPGLYLRPEEARAEFERRGWQKVAAFQTRNPMHRSHEHLAKIAAEVTDGVFIHQVLGKLKAGDIPAEIRTKAIQAMIDNYFKPNIAIQAGYPIEMRYAGPREALIHALIRQNFGCSHLVVGRDHAGVGDYYGPFDAQTIFDELWAGALLCQPLKIDVTFYCQRCDGMATGKTCPHDAKHHLSISGTRQREMLSKGEHIPPQFSRPEVVAILQQYYQRQALPA
ncbi:MAG TPA: sulfate adenylyltransferase [Burkholderiaceae bacterium]|nr:sulfate adenylyltransferase [Burkholderiaceae bacterium]